MTVKELLYAYFIRISDVAQDDLKAIKYNMRLRDRDELDAVEELIAIIELRTINKIKNDVLNLLKIGKNR